MDVYHILNYGVKNKASDIHITQGDKIRYRINGDLIAGDRVLSKEDLKIIKSQLLDQEERNTLYENKFIDKSMGDDFHRFRIHVYKENNGYALAIRIIGNQILSIEELYLPKQVENIRNLKSGLVIITGSTGQGKTTSLAAIIEDINKRESRHIVSIENPIEYRFFSKKSLIHQRELGRDLIDLSQGIETVVRQDPDIIILGEMRTKESIKLALSLAELGHLVISTLHSRSVIETISRVVDVFEKEDKNHIRRQLSSSLEYIINQELIKIKGSLYPVCEVLKMNPASRNIIKNGENLSGIKDQMQMDRLNNIMKDDSYNRIIKLINKE